MLDFERGRAFHSQNKRRRFGLRFIAGVGARARPVDLQWLAVGRYFRADNIRPARQDFARGKALRFHDAAQGRAEKCGKRPGKTARRFGHGVIWYAIV
jgi:hypothetical protein